jgi:hypothetical protein
MKRYLTIVAIVICGVGFLALASYLTTSMNWDGGFPSGEFRINFRDTAGRPVKGAILRVYHGGTRDLAFGYPLDNHLEDHDLVSDESGRITAIRTNGRLQFGGHAWALFWIIPIGAKGPEFDCQITADGYKPIDFRIRRLFESPYRSYEDFPKTKQKVHGEEVELKIYEHTFTLER